jgi:hypothetical protein
LKEKFLGNSKTDLVVQALRVDVAKDAAKADDLADLVDVTAMIVVKEAREVIVASAESVVNAASVAIAVNVLLVERVGLQSVVTDHFVGKIVEKHDHQDLVNLLASAESAVKAVVGDQLVVDPSANVSRMRS